MNFLALFCCIFFNQTHANTLDGPGMIITYYGTRKDVSIYIRSAHLPNGKDFPSAGSFGYAKNGLAGGATMGAAPDGRQLPEWIDFEWQEPPYPGLENGPSEREAYKDWHQRVDEQFRTLPLKHQRVMVRSRIPKEIVNEAIDENRHFIASYGPEKRLSVYFIWTSQGIKMHWQIWHTPKFSLQYYSNEGGDDVIPEGITTLAIYANTIRNANTVVHPGSHVSRTPPLGQSGFSGSWAFAYTERPLDGGGLVVTTEREQQLPESINFDWRLFPLSTPRKLIESDAEYQSRVYLIYNALSITRERVEVRQRIPLEVQDEIATATRNLVADKISNSIIYLYFIWTESGIKFYWRLWQKTAAGGGEFTREGGDEILSSTVTHAPIATLATPFILHP